MTDLQSLPRAPQQVVRLLVGRRSLAPLAVALTLAASLLPMVARADTKSELDAARERLAQINDEIDGQQSELNALSSEVDAQAAEITRAEGRLEAIRAELASTRNRARQAQRRYEALRSRLNDRAVQLYMHGVPDSVEFVLGSESLSDLTDRLEYTTVVAQSDTDLANQVMNLKNELDLQLQQQTSLLEEEASALSGLKEQLAQLDDKFVREQALLDGIEAKRAEAEQLVSGLQKKYQDELRRQVPPPPTNTGGVVTSTGGSIGSNPFQACPVGSPMALTDSFGAPRYGGGYHLHMGNDIMAPSGTPIYATFAGTVVDASNSLGGIAVRVVGSQGWTYNAHMSSIAKLGSVAAGELIGSVGATGDTSTPHNHFEFHPSVLPSGWPASSYGYSTIEDAVNPYPILVGVC